ncbi:MAG: hypothetical protein ACPGES_06755 [Coraliomargarita sp.]
MLIRYFITITLLAAASILHAQSEPAKVRLTALSLNARIMDLKYESRGQVESLYAYKHQRSEAFNYTGPQTITFFRESASLDKDGKPIRTTVATCKLPRKRGQYLLILSKVAQDTEAYRIIPIVDDWEKFKPGTYRFLNLAPFDIALKLEDTVHTIKERNFTDVGGDFKDKSNQKAIMVSLPEGEEPVRVFQGHMRYTNDLRMLYIITPKKSSRAGRVDFIAVPQRVSTRQKKSEKAK